VKVEIVDRGPHEFCAAPTKRLPTRTRCVWCGVYGDVRSDSLPTPHPALCPSNGDEVSTIDVDGIVFRLWRGRRTRGPVVASIESDWAIWSWNARPDRGAPSHEYLRGFATGVVGSRGAPPPLPSPDPAPLPKNVIVVDFGSPG